MKTPDARMDPLEWLLLVAVLAGLVTMFALIFQP